MPREARVKSRSGMYHIILRGINKQTIFEDDEDRFRFLKTLEKYKEVSGYILYGYCLMDNHIHLLIKEEKEPLSLLMKRISSSYVYWFNMKYERHGHLFQERFKSENVENPASFLTVLRYIHQNPMKAGLAENVIQSKWTSMKQYLQGESAGMVDIDFGLSLFSQNRVKARKLYTSYMQQQNNDQCMEYVVRVRRSDSEVLKYMKELGIANVTSLQQMNKQNRNTLLIELKQINGVSIRQLSRITGISKSVIHRL